MKYTVKIRMVEILEAVVEADSFDEAYDAAMELDAEELTETPECSWDAIQITDENGKEMFA